MNPILGISGSLRKASFNSALLQAACGMFPDTIEPGMITGIPLYNGDIEQEGVPDTVLELKQQLIGARGLLLVTPEYNQSVPGVLKNTIDWLSRPSLGVNNVFRDKPVALLGASPGRFGTVLAQDAWLPVFRGLGARLWNGNRLMVSGVGSLIDDQGKLVDADTRNRLENFIKSFVVYCEA